MTFLEVGKEYGDVKDRKASEAQMTFKRHSSANIEEGNRSVYQLEA